MAVVSSKKPVAIDAIIRMRETLSHRGPDSAGAWISPDRSVGLAHRRLSILDLSDAGHQPMTDVTQTAWIVFNGEIYNFQALRDRLKSHGYIFRGNSDTEVLLNAYLHWGTGCLCYLNGMWAFAVWDQRRRQLFMARDRAGQKPLYYAHTPDHLSVASQLKALVVEPGTHYHLDLSALNSYLALGYVPGQQCIASPARKLPPAHAALYDVAADTLSIWRYWTPPLPQERTSAPPPKTEDISERLESLLSDSVRLRLISDVPLGMLLSGGVDSSLITSLAARHTGGALKTFTISFPGNPRYDEAPYARRVATYFGTDHHELEAPAPCLDFLPKLTAYFDEPLADSSLLPTYLVSCLTRERVTVALGGDGGDELFAGYKHYVNNVALHRAWRWVPLVLWRQAASLARRLPAGVKGRNFCASLCGGPLRRQIHGSCYFDPTLRQRLYQPDVLRELTHDLDAPEQWLSEIWSWGHGEVDRMTRLDFHTYLADDILAKVDRASMAVGLEVRAPWLDVRIVEFALGLVPSHCKINGRVPRSLQRLLAKRLLPPDLDLDRKQGFSVPMDDWLRQPQRLAALEDVLTPSRTLPWFRRDEITALIKGQLRGRANGARLFSLLVLSYALEHLRTLGVSLG